MQFLLLLLIRNRSKFKQGVSTCTQNEGKTSAVAETITAIIKLYALKFLTP